VTDSERGPEPADHVAIREQLSDYVEGTLAGSARERVGEHLEGCPPCRAFLRTLERTIDLTRGLPRHALPERARRRILDRLATTADSRGGA
jgi:predicted anti-sigma-YlaC factor YlaD